MEIRPLIRRVLAVAAQVCVLVFLVPRVAPVEGVEVAGGCVPVERQLGSVPAEYEIARIEAVRAGGCMVNDLTINPRAPLLRWTRFCISARYQWEWH